MVKEEQIDFISLMETGRDQFPDVTLKKLCGGKEYIWHCMAPHGCSRGILLGVDFTVYDIGAINEENFYVNSLFEIKMMALNGSYLQFMDLHNSKTKNFLLTEMAYVCSKGTLPYIIGGDFNIMRRPEDKNKDNFDLK
jgi:hypothetical protein